MDRRSFVTLGTLSAIVAPSLILSGCKGGTSSDSSPMAGGVFYTKENPGRWNASKTIKGHLPSILHKDKTKELVVTTKHGMKSYDHYIIKHILLNSRFEFIDEKLFKIGEAAKPESTYKLDSGDLKGYKGTLYALSVCNLHDTWLNEITI
jgi:superoxide reductase